MIDPKINTLLTLSSLGTFTKAAQALSLTQPAVSHHIKQLELEYGIQIFYKDKKKLSITPEGAVLLKYARRAAALSENARKAIEDCKRSVKSLTLGITPTAEENLVPQIFAAYCNRHPNIHINILTDTIKNIYGMLKSYEIDLAIVEGRIADERFISVLLDTDYLCLAVSPAHPLASRRSAGLPELKKENFILRLPGSGTRVLFENHLISHSENIRDFNVIMELDNLSIIKELVASNLGVTVISHRACKQELASGRLAIVPIENMSMVREINLVHPKDFGHPEILEELRQTYQTSH